MTTIERTIAASLLTLSVAFGADAGTAGIRYVEGDLDLASDLGTASAEANEPLGAGDGLTTGPSGRAEIGLPDGSLLWLDSETRLDIVALGSDDLLLRLWRGGMALRLADLNEGASARIDSSAGSAFLLDRGRYTVRVDRDGATAVHVHAGLAEVGGRRASVLVRSGERTSVYAGEDPENAYRANSARLDGFDAWVEDRVASERAHIRYYEESSIELPAPVRPYAGDLVGHGSWDLYEPLATYVWRPQVSVGWRPYSDGWWSHRSDGLTWISHEPWGFVTYHYGSWDYAPRYGWFWVPGQVYGPAWVDWYVYDDYYAWSPRREYSYHDHHGHERWTRHDHDRGDHSRGHHGDRNHDRGHGDDRDRTAYRIDPDRATAVRRERLLGRRLRDEIVPPQTLRDRAPLRVTDRLDVSDLGDGITQPLRRVIEERATATANRDARGRGKSRTGEVHESSGAATASPAAPARLKAVERRLRRAEPARESEVAEPRLPRATVDEAKRRPATLPEYVHGSLRGATATPEREDPTPRLGPLRKVLEEKPALPRSARRDHRTVEETQGAPAEEARTPRPGPLRKVLEGKAERAPARGEHRAGEERSAKSAPSGRDDAKAESNGRATGAVRKAIERAKAKEQKQRETKDKERAESDKD